MSPLISTPTPPLARRSTLALCASLLLPALAGCTQDQIDPMVKQAKYKAYAPNPFFADGRSMRTPPSGTVPRERQLGSTQLIRGVDEKGVKISAFPLPLTRALLATGQKKFEIHCAVCHGLSGNGVSLIATQMSLKQPPDLHQKRALATGHIYEVVTNGYGLMAGYGVELSVEERWAVVAYVRALQRSQNATLGDATPQGRAELESTKERP
jgi:mono/diheme cytochrome c family protein